MLGSLLTNLRSLFSELCLIAKHSWDFSLTSEHEELKHEITQTLIYIARIDPPVHNRCLVPKGYSSITLNSPKPDGSHFSTLMSLKICFDQNSLLLRWQGSPRNFQFLSTMQLVWIKNFLWVSIFQVGRLPPSDYYYYTLRIMYWWIFK